MIRILLFILLLTPTVAVAKEDADLDSLDLALDQKEAITQHKEDEIRDKKRDIATIRSEGRLLEAYYNLYQMYYVYQYDSAMVYVNKSLELSQRTGNRYYTALNTLLKSELLAFGGLYSEAVDCIESVDKDELNDYMLFRYYFISHEIFTMWSSYSGNEVYGKEYSKRSNYYLEQCIKIMTPNYDLYNYYLAEYYNYVKPDEKKSLYYYHLILKNHPNTSRVYAMASYAIAQKCKKNGDMEGFKHYMVLAAISDIKNCTKENLALQRLAVYIFDMPNADLQRAERYIKVSMDDAKFYHSRLHMLEISQRLPTIFNAYQQTINERSHNRNIALWTISVLFAILACSAIFMIKQNNQLSAHRLKLAKSNEELQSLNERLGRLNTTLMDTNAHRETLVKLFIDLCASYIDRLNKTQTLVKRKIKANQTAELLSMLSSSRLSTEDAETFMNSFDKTFLNHYPTFIDEFNLLLDPSQPPLALKNGHLTTELRIFALIRLGVNDSSEISSLLFYSPQTIYNYRSSVKARAKNKDTFERDVRQLCSVISV